MSALIDRYWVQHASEKKSADREKSILDGIRREWGNSSSGSLRMELPLIGGIAVL